VLVRRQGLPWLVALPSVAAGLLAGHAFGSRLVGPRSVELAERTERAAAHASSVPVVLGFLGALVLVGLVVLIRVLLKGRIARSVSPLLFLVLPSLAWPVQEVLERALHAEGLGVHPFLDPGLVLGVAVQIPFGIAAFLAARLLFVVAVKVAASFARRNPRPRRRRETIRPPRLLVGSHRTRVTALRRAQRAPPLAA